MMENPALSELASRWQFDGDEYQIRFDLLAKYLVENGNSFDSHFKSQYESCRLCTIKYDYIIKLETLHEGKIQSYLRGMQVATRSQFPAENAPTCGQSIPEHVIIRKPISSFLALVPIEKISGSRIT